MKLPELSKLSKRERIMAIAGIVIVVCVLADRLVISPWVGYLDKIKSDRAKLERLVSHQKKLINRKKIVEQELKAYGEYLHSSASPDLEMASFLKEIETLGRESNIALQEVRPLPSSSTDRYNEYGLEVHYECELNQWIEFVHSVESSTALFVIERASISMKNEESKLLKGVMRIRRTVVR